MPTCADHASYLLIGAWILDLIGEGQGSDEGVHCQVVDTASIARRKDRVDKQTSNLLAGLLKIQSVVLNGTVHEFRSVTWIYLRAAHIGSRQPHQRARTKIFRNAVMTPDYA